MRAEIKTITPEFATELLKMNVGNRRLKNIKNAYIGQMLNGEWKENGEPIIIDINGFVKDGQHRLNAVIEANYSYVCPIIYDVDPNVMDTIDTGTNRSASDVLELNGFIQHSQTASVITRILSRNLMERASGNNRVSTVNYVNNQRVLEYALLHKKEMHDLVKCSDRIYSKMDIKTCSKTDISVMVYLIGGLNFRHDHSSFVQRCCGISSIEGTSANWYHKKRTQAKLSKVTLSAEWKLNAFIKCWNHYVLGDTPMNHIKVDHKKVETPLELKF